MLVFLTKFGLLNLFVGFNGVNAAMLVLFYPYAELRTCPALRNYSSGASCGMLCSACSGEGEVSSQAFELNLLLLPLDSLDTTSAKFWNRILDTFNDASTGMCLLPAEFNVILLFVLGVALTLSNLSSASTYSARPSLQMFT